MRGRTVLSVAVLVGIFVAALTLVLATRDPVGERKDSSALIGKVAPAVQGTTVDGRPMSIDDYRGRWVALNFFGSWCTECITEHPELLAFDQAHRTKGDAVLIGVTFDDKRSDAQEFYEVRGGTWPVLNDPENSVGVAYGIAKVPETWLIAPDGIIVERFAGAVTQRELDDAIAHFEGTGP